MGIQSIIGDVKSTVGQRISSFLDQAWAAASGIADTVGTFVANIWSGGFAGVSDFEALKRAIREYSKGVQEIVDNYKTDADLGVTFKGDAATAMTEFITSTKELLMAYVKLVEKWESELDDIYTKYQEGDKNLSQSVNQDSESVLAASKKVDIG